MICRNIYIKDGKLPEMHGSEMLYYYGSIIPVKSGNIQITVDFSRECDIFLGTCKCDGKRFKGIIKIKKE